MKNLYLINLKLLNKSLLNETIKRFDLWRIVLVKI